MTSTNQVEQSPWWVGAYLILCTVGAGIVVILIGALIDSFQSGRSLPSSDNETTPLSYYIIFIPGTRMYVTAVEVAIAAAIISGASWFTNLFFTLRNERRTKTETNLKIAKLELEIQELRAKRNPRALSAKRKRHF